MRGYSRGMQRNSYSHPATATVRREPHRAQRRGSTAQASLAERIQSWIDLDTDPTSIAEVKELQASSDEGTLKDLQDRFGSRLAFGAS